RRDALRRRERPYTRPAAGRLPESHPARPRSPRRSGPVSPQQQVLRSILPRLDALALSPVRSARHRSHLRLRPGLTTFVADLLFYARASRGGAPPLYPAFVAPPRRLAQTCAGAPPPRPQAYSAAASVSAAE